MFALISCEKPGRIPARLQGARLAGRIGRLAVVELQRAQLSALREYLETQGGEIFSAWERSQAFVRETPPRERRARREDRQQARRERRICRLAECGQGITAYAVILLLVVVIVLVILVFLGAGSGPEVGSLSNSWGVIPRLFELAKHFPLR